MENTRDQLIEDGHKKALHIKLSKNPHIQLKDTLQNRQLSRYLDGSVALRNCPNTKDGQKLPSKEEHPWYNADNRNSTPTEPRNTV